MKVTKSAVYADFGGFFIKTPTYLSYSLSFTFMTIIYEDKLFLQGKDNTEKNKSQIAKKAAKLIMKFLKSRLFIILSLSLIIFCTAAFAAASFILPEKVTVSQSETHGRWIPKELSWIVTSKETLVSPAMENTAKALDQAELVQSYNEKIYLCGVLPIKTVEVAVVDNIYVTPGGESIGINLKTEGVLSVGIAKFECKNKKISPAEDAGIRPGDIFTKINGKAITKAGEMSEIIENSNGKITLTGIRNNKEMLWEVTPQKDDTDGRAKIGLWIREGVAGIGTVSFYTDSSFAALGHPISDIDTGSDVRESGGTICHAKVIGVEKGEKGSPGSLMGVFSGEEVGEITANTYCGVYGTIKKAPQTPKLRLASKNEVRPGKATIRCDIGGDKVESFDIEIIRIASTGNTSKNMIIKVTDKKLLAKTGGIVQGMSGSPIIQNGRIVGAVTHVFVNDPTRGYGIFIENMLAEAEKIK